MEKQKSFSVKPIKFLVFSFTISFSVIFLIFFSTWVIKTAPSLHGGSGPHNLDFTTSSSSTVQSLKGFNSSSSSSSTSSSEYVLKNSILMGAHFGRRGEKNSSQIANGNSISTPSGKNVFVDGVISASNSSKSSGVDDSEVTDVISSGGIVNSKIADAGFQESNDVIVDTGIRNSSIGKKDIASDISHISIRNDIEKKSKLDCDISKGRWVIDESYPLYTNSTCPFIDEGFNCETNGRLNKDYMKWRWQPQDCDIPRFNATKMLELIRGKRLVFVGDSINRNQWESMLCLLMGGVKDPKKVYEARGRKITKEKGNYCFKFEDYKCTVEYYVSHFLVHESKARIGSKKRAQTLRIDAVDKGSSRWRGADILVFNTAHWWSHSKTKAGINYYQEGDQVHPQLDVNKAFRRSLLTWASWVDKNINPRKTRIFFRSSAPSHFRSAMKILWRAASFCLVLGLFLHLISLVNVIYLNSGGLWNTGGHCKEAFRPINETFTSVYPEKNLIVEEIISQMRTPVTFLNITRLSDYRTDAHPSIYGRKTINPGVQDCSHWCLPGVPDNWNELLYYYLQLRTKANFVD